MSKKTFKIAVLASTNGTDLQAIIDEMEAGKMEGIELSAVLSNKKCYALKRAKEQGYKTFYIDPKDKSKEEFDEKLIEILIDLEIDLIVSVGYMKILSKKFINKFSRKVINVHPSLIPKYSGKGFFGANVHKAVLESGDKESGMTIHYLDEGVDSGEIIMQKTCKVSENESPESLKEKVQALEKKYYPEVIRNLAARL